MLALFASASAYVAPLASRPAVASRGAAATMQFTGKYVAFDQDGVYDGKDMAGQKPPVKLLTRVEQLGVLSSLAEAGVLSSAEASGLFSKLEAAGAFSTAEKLLPLADKLQVLALVESLLNVPAATLTLGAVALLAGEVGLITVVPDDNAALVALQAVTGAAAGLGSVSLLGISYLFGFLQAED